MSVIVQKAPFDVATELAKLYEGCHEIGAVTSFLGLVRDMQPGEKNKANQSLTLEHYPGMCESMLEEIEAQAHKRWSLHASLIIHRYGHLKPGEPIVFVATASAHREPAFKACYFLMDWLKTEAPFWKCEQIGMHKRWVEAKESDKTAKTRWEQK